MMVITDSHAQNLQLPDPLGQLAPEYPVLDGEVWI